MSCGFQWNKKLSWNLLSLKPHEILTRKFYLFLVELFFSNSVHTQCIMKNLRRLIKLIKKIADNLHTRYIESFLYRMYLKLSHTCVVYPPKILFHSLSLLSLSLRKREKREKIEGDLVSSVENSIAPLEVRIKNLVLSKVKLSHSVTCFYNFYYVTFIWVFIGLIVPAKRRMMTQFCSSDVKQSKTNPEHNRWTPISPPFVSQKLKYGRS